MKSKLLMTLLIAMGLTGCGAISPKQSSFSSVETPVSTEENISTDEASSSDAFSNRVVIDFLPSAELPDAPLGSLSESYLVSGVEVSSTSSSGIFAAKEEGIRVGSRRTRGSFSFSFSKSVLVESLLITAKGYEDSVNSATASIGDTSVTFDIGGEKGDYGPEEFMGEGDTFTLSVSALRQCFYVYHIELSLGKVAPVYPSSINLTPSTLSMNVGQSKALSVSYFPENTNVKEVSFESLDTSIATVSKNGEIDAVGVGSTTIVASAKAEFGTVKAQTNLTVRPEGTVDKTYIGQTYTDYSANLIYEYDSCPTIGTIKPLVIPVWFTDSSDYITTDNHKKQVREDIHRAYFGTQEETGWHSVKTYYEEESLGQLGIEGVTAPWYECGKASTAFYGGVTDTMSLVSQAVEWYFSLSEAETRTEFDSDVDGYLDAVLLIYAAPDYASMGQSGAGNLWAYSSCMQNSGYKNTKKPGPNAFFWASYDFMYSRFRAFSRAGTYYGGGDTSEMLVDTHTFIHEMGHVFGLDDYYDYSDTYCPAGAFSMQDFNVGGHDPFSVMALGWADPYIPNDECTIELRPFQSSHDLILLTPEWNEFDSPFDEYFLLELYTPTGLNEFDCLHPYQWGYPTGPDFPGIRLWHVDARLCYVESNGSVSENQMTTDANYDAYYGVTLAFSNTYSYDDRNSVLGKDYIDYKLLQLIRNDEKASYNDESWISPSDLFVDGDSFDMDRYASQFVGDGIMNRGVSLGFSFNVSIEGEGEDAIATIDIYYE